MKLEMKQKAAEMVGKRLDVDVTQKSVSINEDNHTAVFVMSTSSVDRHGDVVDQNTWMLDHFQKNPAFFWGHRSNDFPLGKWLRVWLEADPERAGEQMLMGEAEFAVDVHDEIRRAWEHVVRGDLNMVSVGFIPHVVDYDEDRDCFVLKNNELMECSLVGIGSNRRALVKSADAADTLIEVKAQIEESIAPADPAVSRKHNAILLLNKAIRQLKK